MRKHYSGAVVVMRGTGKEIIRTVYTDGSKYYVKWYGEFIEVENKFPGVTARNSKLYMLFGQQENSTITWETR